MKNKMGILLCILMGFICLSTPARATAEQAIKVTVSWNTWDTNFDHMGRAGNFTCHGYYSEKAYFEGAREASFDDPYDVAADLDIFPLGTRLYVGSNIGWVKVVDKCGTCKGRKMIDVWCGKNEYMHRKDNIATSAIVVPGRGIYSKSAMDPRKN